MIFFYAILVDSINLAQQTSLERFVFLKQPNKIKNIFTKVLKGHIAVATCNINKNNTGSKIDPMARKHLKMSGLDYAHGTGHGVKRFKCS